MTLLYGQSTNDLVSAYNGPKNKPRNNIEIRKFHYKFKAKTNSNLMFDNETRNLHGCHSKSPSTCNFHMFPMPQATSAYHIPTTTWSLTSCECISGISAACTTPTSTLNQNFRIFEPWNLSTPQLLFVVIGAYFISTYILVWWLFC